jgi:hypothetical protein
MLKKTGVFLLSVLILTTSVGCTARNNLPDNWASLSQEERETMIDFLTMAEIEALFFENRELLENIRDELFASGFVPHHGVDEQTLRFSSELEMSILLGFNYRRRRLFVHDNPDNEILQSIQNVHEYAIEWFTNVGRDFGPTISFREIRGSSGSSRGTVIEFDFLYPPLWIRAGIMYKPGDDMLWACRHLDGDWYIYWYELG